MRLTSLLTALLVGLAPSARAQAPIAPAIVETVAGPGFCTGTTALDRASASVRSLAVDKDGTVFVSSGRPAEGLVRRVDATGARLLRTGASGVPDSAGRLAAAGGGGVLVALASRLILVDARGTSIQTVAGDPAADPGTTGRASSGDGGPATEARFTAIRAITADEDHNLFVADALSPGSASVRVRVINRGSAPLTIYPRTQQPVTLAPGHIDTIAGVAGDAGPVNSGDAGPARAASVAGRPLSMAAVNDRLYLGLYRAGSGGSDPEARVRLVNLGGDPINAHGVGLQAAGIDTVAGGDVAGFGGDGGPARAAGFSELTGLAADASGVLYLADRLHHRIRHVDDAGTITTFAGIGDTGRNDGAFNGNDRPANEAQLNLPFDVEVGPRGVLYISDEANGQLRVVDASGFIRSAPGNALSPSCLPSRRGTSAKAGAEEIPQPGSPSRVALDTQGQLYFTNSATGALMRINRRGDVTSILGKRGPAGRTVIEKATAVATTTAGIYVLDRGGTRVLFANTTRADVTVHGIRVGAGEVTPVTGGGGSDRGSAEETALSALLQASEPALGGGLAADAKGNLFIADTGNGRVRRISPTGAITTVAGDGGPPGTQECCRRPIAVAMDRRGNLYVADLASFQVIFLNRGARPVEANGVAVAAGTAIAVAGTGKGGVGGDEGGKALDAQLAGPTGVVSGPDGQIYFADQQAHIVRRVDRRGFITTVAGTGQPGFNGDGLDAQLTALAFPSDVAVDRCGNVLVADTGNDRARRIGSSRACSPPDQPDQPGPGGSQSSGLWKVALSGVVVAVVGSAVAYTRRRSMPHRVAGH